jgi:hypothetical protein
MKLVEQLPKKYDIKLITDTWNDIKSQLTEDDWFDTGNGFKVSIQHKGVASYTEGCGWMLDSESDYIYINPLFKDTIFEEIINDFGGFRARMLVMNSKSVYAVHQDRGKRIHLAIESNDSSFFVFPKDEEVYHIPVDGHLYKVDTSKFHTFFNGHWSETRTHMAFGI